MTKPTSQLQSRAGGDWTLEGELTFTTVPALYDQARDAFAGSWPATIDLAGVDRVDSAGVALVIDWLRLARESRQPLSIRNVPQHMLSIAQLCGVGHLLEQE
ncbi:MAG: STAS domain-containing protein [Gammaproteobacteria bacterium]